MKEFTPLYLIFYAFSLLFIIQQGKGVIFVTCIPIKNTCGCCRCHGGLAATAAEERKQAAARHAAAAEEGSNNNKI